jgi:hypothetical protein
MIRCAFGHVSLRLCARKLVYRVGPHPTGIICQKVEVLFVPERYVRSMFPNRARHKLVA